MKPNRPYRIILSGGGTGGHIFPAIAIANGIRERMPDAEILFVGALGKMEMEKVPRAGYPIKGLPITAFYRSLDWRNLLFPFRLAVSLLMAGRIIRKFRPDLVIGTGGYASGPVLRVASSRGIPTLLQEQNSFPGVTNRILAKKVNRICVAFEGMEQYFPPDKVLFTGNPLRPGLVAGSLSRNDSVRHFGLDPAQPVILVFGGSQGSRTLNLSIAGHIAEIVHSGVQVIWQTGVAFHPNASGLIGDQESGPIRVFDFIHEMDKAYSAADLVVCRSGAITLSELAVTGKPAILVPLPTAAADHQTKNAIAFAEAGAAIVVTDKEATTHLVRKMIDLVGDNQRLREMSGRMQALGKPDSTQIIVNEVFKLC